MNTHPIRLLIHPEDTRYIPITDILARATTLYRANFDISIGVPGVVDHIGYHDSTLASTVWVRDGRSRYMRLTIRPGRHVIFDELLKAATE